MGGNEGTMYVDVSMPSYIDFFRVIVQQLRYKIEILHYCVLGKSLKDGLRFFHDDNGVKDIIYHLHGEKLKCMLIC